MLRKLIVLMILTPFLLGAAPVWETVIATENSTSRTDFWAPAVPPRAHYSIEVRLDSVSGKLIGSEVIRFKNDSSKPFSRLALDWALSSRQTVKIAINGTPLQVLANSGEGVISPPLLISLPQVLLPGKEVALTLNFSQSVPGLGEQDKITLTKWFPRLWWGFKTQDDYDVKVQAPPEYNLATSGRMDSRSGYYHAESVGTFGLFLGKGMEVAEANAGDVLVRVLFTKRGEECARFVLKTAVDVINFYRERFGFYPYKSLNIVPGYDAPLGGYNAATSLSVIHGQERMSERPELHWRWITAHEVGHMYWGEYVLEKDSPGWLWIGLGIYGDREYIRARGLSLQMHQELMSRYTKGVKNHVNTTVAITPEQLYDINFDFNNIVIHGKGFSIISALANYLGKETFDRIYKRCLREVGGHRLGLAEFQALCETESGENLGWFFNQWARSNQYLSYQITSQKSVVNGSKYISTISVERLGSMKMPVPVVADFDDGTIQRKVTDRLSDVNTLEFVSNAPLKKAVIDPDGELAMIVPPPEMTMEELTRSINRLPWAGAGREALTAFNKARELRPTSADIWFKLGLMLYDGEYHQQALEAFRRTVEVAGDSSITKFGGLVWQGHILDILGQRDLAIQQYKLALSRESGQELHHSQYDMVVNRKWVEQRLEKPFARK